jgi:hypothetical protein
MRRCHLIKSQIIIFLRQNIEVETRISIPLSLVIANFA